MKSKTKRFVTVLIAISFSMVLIFFFTKIGDSSKGPLEDIFVKISSIVDDWDNQIVTKRNSRDRAKSMVWFETYRQNIDSLTNSSIILLGAYDNNTEKSFQSILDIENNMLLGVCQGRLSATLRAIFGEMSKEFIYFVLAFPQIILQ